MRFKPIKLYNLTDNTSYKLETIMTKQSKKFSLNSEDAKRVLKNAAIFLAPALLIFLVQVQGGVAMSEALNAVYLWGINTAIDLLRKFIAGTK